MHLRTTALTVAGMAFGLLTAVPGSAQDQAPPAPTTEGWTDQEIISLFNYANTAQITSGKVAQEKGKAAQVKDMARSFVNSHQQLRQQGKDLAAKLAMGPQPAEPVTQQPVEPMPPDTPRPQEPAPVEPKDPWQEDDAAFAKLSAELKDRDLVEMHRGALEDLRTKTGDDFDRSYIEHEIAFHEKAIETLREDLIPSAQNEELKTLLQNAVPGFEAHLARAKDVRERVIAASSNRR